MQNLQTLQAKASGQQANKKGRFRNLVKVKTLIENDPIPYTLAGTYFPAPVASSNQDRQPCHSALNPHG